VLDLVRWADVVCESFTPGIMKKLGLDYETLRQVKPDVIMLSTCLMGQTGPLAGFAGYGNLAAAMTGFYDLTGWPDRPPAGPFGAYTDYIAPRYNAAAILAALEHRRLTGAGQHIDLSQAEAALHFLAPAILDYTVNGVVATRDGNRDHEQAPHGVYPCAGADRWVAIAARDDRDWRALCAALGAPALAADARFATAAARLAARDEVDALVANLTAPLEMEEIERRPTLQACRRRRLQQPRAARDLRSASRYRVDSASDAGAGGRGPRFRLAPAESWVRRRASRQHAVCSGRCRHDDEASLSSRSRRAGVTSPSYLPL
jgi:benzylsuccinate CoA-transferase BbsF subunit